MGLEGVSRGKPVCIMVSDKAARARRSRWTASSTRRRRRFRHRRLRHASGKPGAVHL